MVERFKEGYEKNAEGEDVEKGEGGEGGEYLDKTS